MTRTLAWLFLLSCGGNTTPDRLPYVEDTAPPFGTETLKQACLEACDVRYTAAAGCPPETSGALRDDCGAACRSDAPRLAESCLATAEAYYACIEDQDWLCAQGENEPRVLDETACAAETAALESCPV